MNQKLWWYTVRASGMIAWVLVVASVLWGLALSARATRRPRPAWVLDLHRFLAGLTFAFVGIHLIGLLADSYVGFGFSDMFVVYASKWRPGAVAWGIGALYLLIAVEVTSVLMRRMSRRFWHTVHLLSFVIFISVTAHALLAGADAGNSLVRWFAIGSSTAAMSLLLVRALRRAPSVSAARQLQGDDIAAGLGRQVGRDRAQAMDPSRNLPTSGYFAPTTSANHSGT